MGGTEWLLIALVVLLLFGGKKIPELMKGLGKGINEFKKGKNESEEKAEEIKFYLEDISFISRPEQGIREQ